MLDQFLQYLHDSHFWFPWVDILPFKIPRSCCFLAILKVWRETGVVSVSMCLILPTLIATWNSTNLIWFIYALPMFIQISPPKKAGNLNSWDSFKGSRCLPQSTPQTPPKKISLRFRMIFWGKKSPGYMEANTLDVELARVLCLTHIRAPRLMGGPEVVSENFNIQKLEITYFF